MLSATFLYGRFSAENSAKLNRLTYGRDWAAKHSLMLGKLYSTAFGLYDF